ncbi:MAG: DUF58 domain-containing protein [Planctomycetota bacterium]
MTGRFAEAVASGRAAASGLVLVSPGSSRGVAGEALGMGRGESAEFVEHRDYAPGDDLRRIDWQAMARSDRLVVRQFRDEVTPTLEVRLDASRSMDLGGTAKGVSALACAACLAEAGRAGGFGVGVVSAGSGAAERVDRLESFAGFEGRGAMPIEIEGLGEGGGVGRGLGVRAVVSDLLFSCEPAAAVASWGRSCGRLVVVRLVALSDVDPRMGRGVVRLRDRETGRLIEVVPEAGVLGRVRERARVHAESWRSACAAAGARFIEIVAGDALDAGMIARLLVRGGVLSTGSGAG